MTQKMIVILTGNGSHIHTEPTSPHRQYITVTIEVPGSLIIKLWFVANIHDKIHLIAWSAHAVATESRKETSNYACYTWDRLQILAHFVACMAAFSLSFTQKAICLRLLPTWVKLLILKIVQRKQTESERDGYASFLSVVSSLVGLILKANNSVSILQCHLYFIFWIRPGCSRLCDNRFSTFLPNLLPHKPACNDPKEKKN